MMLQTIFFKVWYFFKKSAKFVFVICNIIFLIIVLDHINSCLLSDTDPLFSNIIDTNLINLFCYFVLPSSFCLMNILGMIKDKNNCLYPFIFYLPQILFKAITMWFPLKLHDKSTHRSLYSKVLTWIMLIILCYIILIFLMILRLFISGIFMLILQFIMNILNLENISHFFGSPRIRLFEQYSELLLFFAFVPSVLKWVYHKYHTISLYETNEKIWEPQLLRIRRKIYLWGFFILNLITLSRRIVQIQFNLDSWPDYQHYFSILVFVLVCEIVLSVKANRLTPNQFSALQNVVNTPFDTVTGGFGLAALFISVFQFHRMEININWVNGFFVVEDMRGHVLRDISYSAFNMLIIVVIYGIIKRKRLIRNEGCFNFSDSIFIASILLIIVRILSYNYESIFILPATYVLYCIFRHKTQDSNPSTKIILINDTPKISFEQIRGIYAIFVTFILVPIYLYALQPFAPVASYWKDHLGSESMRSIPFFIYGDGKRILLTSGRLFNLFLLISLIFDFLIFHFNKKTIYVIKNTIFQFVADRITLPRNFIDYIPIINMIHNSSILGGFIRTLDVFSALVFIHFLDVIFWDYREKFLSIFFRIFYFLLGQENLYLFAWIVKDLGSETQYGTEVFPRIISILAQFALLAWCYRNISLVEEALSQKISDTNHHGITGISKLIIGSLLILFIGRFILFSYYSLNYYIGIPIITISFSFKILLEIVIIISIGLIWRLMDYIPQNYLRSWIKRNLLKRVI